MFHVMFHVPNQLTMFAYDGLTRGILMSVSPLG